MLQALAEVDSQNQYLVWLRPGQRPGRNWPSNFQFKNISLPRLWTQLGLAAQSWLQPVDLLWVPAHTLPVFGKFNLPMVVTIHGIEYQYLPSAYHWLTNWHLTWSTRWAAIRAQQIVAVSGQTKQDLIDWLGVDPNKVKVVYEGVDTKRFRQSGKQAANQVCGKYGLRPGYVLFVGTLQPRKNLVTLIQAFARFVKQTQHQTELVIGGKPGWGYQEIHQQPKTAGIASQVKFLGFVPDEDLPGLYAAAGVYAEPSLQEGFGLPVLEAMASRVPVLAANAGALAEIAGPGAILLPALDVNAWATALQVILSPKSMQLSARDFSSWQIPPQLEKISVLDWQQALIKLGAKRSRQFDWQVAAKQMLDLWQALV